MHECLKALKTLSTVGEAATVVENVEEQDVPVRCGNCSCALIGIVLLWGERGGGMDGLWLHLE